MDFGKLGVGIGGSIAVMGMGGFTLGGVAINSIPTIAMTTICTLALPMTIGTVGCASLYGAYRVYTKSDREYKKMILEEREYWNKFWEGLGIKNKKNEMPILANIWKSKHGHIYSFIKPLGLATKDLENKYIAISEYLNCEKLEFKSEGDFINIETNESKLPTLIPYKKQDVKDKTKLQISFGEDINGKVTTTFDEANGHLIISGTSGGGKSCATRVGLTSLVQNYTSDEVELWLGDFKIVELTPFQYTNITTRFTTKKEEIYEMVLDLQEEMKNRYDLFTKYRANDIRTFNKKVPKRYKMKRIVFFIEEIAEFYQNENINNDKEKQKYIKEVYEAILKISQQGRACGIHLWMTLQRPDAKSFPPSIKANIPTRFCLATSDATNSEIILGRGDGSASELRGNGHAIIKNGEGKSEIQTYYIPFENLDDELYPYLTDEGKELVDRDKRRNYII